MSSCQLGYHYLVHLLFFLCPEIFTCVHSPCYEIRNDSAASCVYGGHGGREVSFGSHSAHLFQKLTWHYHAWNRLDGAPVLEGWSSTLDLSGEYMTVIPHTIMPHSTVSSDLILHLILLVRVSQITSTLVVPECNVQFYARFLWQFIKYSKDYTKI
jgi:hypothetical protein